MAASERQIDLDRRSRDAECQQQGEQPRMIKSKVAGRVEQAERTGMPADEVTLIADTVIVRPDPVATA